MHIFTDVSNLLAVDFLTGIQRVVRELLIRLLHDDAYDLTPLVWDAKRKAFLIVESQSFMEILETPGGDPRTVKRTSRIWDFTSGDHEAEAVFLDLDAVWINFMRRSYLYAALKRSGYAVVTMVYDVIPVLFPQFSHQDTVFRFYNYFTACLKYADVLLTNTANTRRDILTLCEACKISPKHIEIVPLGMDFASQAVERGADDVREDAVRAAAQGRYLLMVGTIEPRKNHAFLLDCLETYLLDEPVNLVFAGRIGWNMQDFEKRIREHPLLGKRLFFIEKANDATIDYLYRSAFLFVCASCYEGFGLPILEALGHGLPALVSDIPVFHEVGGDSCDYFSLDNPSALAGKVRGYLADAESYEAARMRAVAFRSNGWDDAARELKSALGTISIKKLSMPKTVEQIFILSARVDDLLAVFPYIEKYMHFIKKVLIACPSFMCDEVRRSYQGTLSIDFLTDEENLSGEPLPKDHETRNFFLRCRAMRSEKLDDCFLMYDDDYRPLVDIRQEDFLEEDRYKAYYFYDLVEWQGYAREPTSFDRGMYKTRRFLLAQGYPTLQYSAHMPQIIDKRVYLEMLAKHPGMEYEGYDEWSVYFNYAIARYPRNFKNEVYRTLCWPGFPTDWDLMVMPKEYLFENYYPGLYEKGKILEGHEAALQEETERGKLAKILARHNQQMERETYRTADRVLDQWLMRTEGANPQYVLRILGQTAELCVPKLFYGHSFFRKKVALWIKGWEEVPESDWDLEIEYEFYTLDGKSAGHAISESVGYGIDNVQFPIWTPRIPGEYVLHLAGRLKKPVCEFEANIRSWIYDI